MSSVMALRRLWHAFLAVAIVVILSLGSKIYGEASGPKPEDYNVLLISVDDVRADHLGCYGYHRTTSPNLDQLAREGVLFENVTAASTWTTPSHMSMFTALYPSVHGCEDFQSSLGDAVPTLAQVMQKHGHTTAGFATGPCMSYKLGFDRGFEFYDDFTVTLMLETNLFEDLDADSPILKEVPTNHVITNLASTWLKLHGHKKFFLFVHYYDPHWEYVPPAPYDRKFVDPGYKGRENSRNIGKSGEEIEANISPEELAHFVNLYDGEIAHTDNHVGKLLRVLRDTKLLERTLVIVVSDHGEGFLEHGKLFHGSSLFEEVLHVPLIMRLPGVLPAGLRVKGNVSHVDIMPTILGLLRIPMLSDAQGMDLSAVCRGEGEVPPDRMVFSKLHTLRAVRWGPYKLVQPRGRTAMPLLVVREGAERDAREAGVDAKQCDKIEEQMAKALRAGPGIARQASSLAKPVELDRKTLESLRSLGYLE